jgi:hypothetical protein
MWMLVINCSYPNQWQKSVLKSRRWVLYHKYASRTKRQKLRGSLLLLKPKPYLDDFMFRHHQSEKNSRFTRTSTLPQTPSTFIYQE